MNSKYQGVNYRSNCAISSALDLIGDKWSLLILRDIMFFDKKTFSEFAASEEKIATNILSDRLSNLENAGIIKKGKIPGNKKTNIYSLTPKGITFLPSLIEVILWSDKNLPNHITPENKILAETIKKDKNSFIEIMYAKLEKGITQIETTNNDL